jgi:hypothetical protein
MLLGFGLSFFLVMGSFSAVYVRYMTPLLPVLCLLAASSVLSLSRLPRWSRARPWVVTGLAVLVLGEPVYAAEAYSRLVNRVDTRVEAYRFLLTLPPHTAVATYGPRVTWQSTIPRWQPFSYAKDPRQSWMDVLSVLKARGYRYFLMHQSRLELFSPTFPELELALRHSATLIREFSPYRTGRAASPVYDTVDAYYFPIGGFRGVKRPGPLVRVYRLD